MIRLEQVTKIYQQTVCAVDSVSFTVPKDEVFGLIGTSGCGKTTTLKLINRLVVPTSGQIFIDGKDIAAQQAEQLRRNIGYVIQSVGLFPHYSIRENIATVPRLLGWDDRNINRRCDELLELVGLDPTEFTDRRPEALSGGQRQRVGFARALAADPSLILMDEPFGALDPITKEKIQQEFKQLLKQINKTIVLVTHDVSEAFDLCGRVALMDSGRIQQIGSPKELLLKPANAFVSSFFNVNRLELEMQTIAMRDLLDVIALSDFQPSRTNHLTASLSASVAEVLNRSENLDYLVEYVLLREEDEIIGRVKVDELLSAFHTYRRTMRERSNG